HAAFDIYSNITIHEEMIADTVRTNTYRTGALRNSSSIQSKVVLDVGEGSGVDASSIADRSVKIVKNILRWKTESKLALAVSVSGLH
uniref:Protein arginine N-methyltransferase 6 n=1 Tax=Salmo trutta TaxID=8032 RepID=A0A673ZGJ1_SALTR